MWLQLEEKRIPYTIEKINMRCYGGKPPEFLAKVMMHHARTHAHHARGSLQHGACAWQRVRVAHARARQLLRERATERHMLTRSGVPTHTAQVPSGLLPVLELDGRVVTESAVIMNLLESEFPEHKPLMPAAGTPQRARADSLMRLERRFFSDWCGHTAA